MIALHRQGDTHSVQNLSGAFENALLFGVDEVHQTQRFVLDQLLADVVCLIGGVDMENHGRGQGGHHHEHEPG